MSANEITTANDAALDAHKCALHARAANWIAHLHQGQAHHGVAENLVRYACAAARHSVLRWRGNVLHT